MEDSAATPEAGDGEIPGRSSEPALDEGIDVIRQTPLNGETPPGVLVAPVTPSDHVYVRTNFGIPILDARTHRIEVGGAVASAFGIGLDDLVQLEQATALVTMECAGNDRTAIVPPVDGEPWTGGAVSTVRWSGVRLASILERARLDPGTVEVLFEGADGGHVEGAGGTINFARALPVSDAVHPDTLLATHMNGEPLRPRYGAPVRLVVPRWFGMASVKWLRRIEALTSPFEGYFQSQRYIYDDGHRSTPVSRMRVKSLIADPIAGSVLAAGRTRITGWAWSGEGAVTSVEVRDASEPGWHPATLHAPESESAWVRWEIELELRGTGSRVLLSRARDAAGNIQPEAPPWNVLGYGNNAIRATPVHVTTSEG